MSLFKVFSDLSKITLLCLDVYQIAERTIAIITDNLSTKSFLFVVLFVVFIVSCS